MEYFDKVEQAAAAVRDRIQTIPAVAIVLGSGLGPCATALQNAVEMPYRELPHWPASTVAGHDGLLTIGTLSGHPVVALAGRCHVYEGHSLQTVTFAIRVLGRLGVRTLVLTNAAGAVNPALAPGAFMAIDDHLNLLGANPLEGPNDDRFGPRFPDMSEVYSRRLQGVADRAAAAVGVALAHGVYAVMRGPSYETPAEIRALRAMGADAVGMSTVPEAIVARHMGLEVLGISCITNMAAGILPDALSHAEVVAATGRSQERMTAMLEAIVART